MKTKDNYFRGFPAVWNLAAFYLYLLEPPEWAAGDCGRGLAGAESRRSDFFIRCGCTGSQDIALLGLWAVLAFVDRVVEKFYRPDLYVTIFLAYRGYLFVVG